VKYPYKRRSRATLIEKANENSITTLIRTLVTRQEKVKLVTERNPLHYMFGEYLSVRKGSESYEEFINRSYIGESNGKSKKGRTSGIYQQALCTSTTPTTAQD